MDVDTIRRMWTFRAYVWGLRCVLVVLPMVILSGLLPGWVAPPALVLAVTGLALGIPLRVQAFWRLDIPYMALFMLGLNDAMPPFLRSKPSAFRNPAGLHANRRSGLLVPMAPPSPAQQPTPLAPMAAPTPASGAVPVSRAQPAPGAGAVPVPRVQPTPAPASGAVPVSRVQPTPAPASGAVPVPAPQAQPAPGQLPMAPPFPEPRPSAEEEKLADVRGSGNYRLSVWGHRLMLLSLVSCCAGVIADDAVAPWVLLVPSATLFAGFLLTFPLRHDSQWKLWLSPRRIFAQRWRDIFNPTFW